MRAAVLPGINEKIDYFEDVELLPPGPGEVRVRVAASGVCHSDIGGQNGTFPQPTPCVLGHEGAGEIVEVGEGVTEVAPGDHVIVSWVPPCGACASCLRGQPHLCMTLLAMQAVTPHFSRNGETLYGFAGTGTFAEELVIREQGAIKIDSEIPFDIASLIGCGVMTGVGAALNTAAVQPGSSVVVFGCGGVGISAIQGARIAGASTIVGVDLVDSKLDIAKRFGATHAVKPNDVQGAINEVTAGEGFDYAFEVIGTPGTIRAAYDATRRGGTTVVVGAGRMEEQVAFSPYELFFMEKRILGCFYGSADVRTDYHKLLGYWRDGALDLEGMITRRIDVSEVNEAFDAMLAGEVIRSVIEFG
jgi:S-(hydroxymethyl)glutathione dehydrogenase/alcohol dehydrogenase